MFFLCFCVSPYKTCHSAVVHYCAIVCLCCSIATDESQSVQSWAMQKWLNWSRCHLGCGLRWAQGSMHWWVSRSPHMKGNFEGKNGPAQNMPGHVWWLIYSKWLSRGQKRYGADSNWSVLDGVPIGATWWIRLNRPCVAAMQSYGKLLWPLIFLFIIEGDTIWPAAPPCCITRQCRTDS